MHLICYTTPRFIAIVSRDRLMHPCKKNCQTPLQGTSAFPHNLGGRKSTFDNKEGRGREMAKYREIELQGARPGSMPQRHAGQVPVLC